MRKSFIYLMLIAAALTTFSLFGSQTASATAKNCTQHHVGRVCSVVYGSGARVDRVSASRENWDVRHPEVCDYSADISVLDGRNQAHVKFFAHPVHWGCTWGDFYAVSADVHRVFACGDVVSVRWYDREGGASGFVNTKLC